jgi:hypothetical protein
VRSNLRPREQRAQRPLVTAGLVARVRQALRPLRRSSRSTKPRSRHRRIRLLRSRANKGRVRHRRLRRSKGRRCRPSHDRNRRLAARPRTLRLRRSLVRHRRRPRIPVGGQPPVQCPCGIRRRLQDLKSLSGRGSALDGRPNGLRAMWRRRRLRSNLGLLLRSRRRPHVVGQVRRLRRHVRALRPGRRLVGRCSRGQHRELSPGSRLVRRCSRGQHRELSPAHLVSLAPQRLLVWRLQPPHRSVRRRRPDRPARRRDLAVQARPLAVRLPDRARQRVPRSQRPHPDRNRVRLPDRRHPPERRVRRCSHLLRRRCRQRARCTNRSSGTHSETSA